MPRLNLDTAGSPAARVLRVIRIGSARAPGALEACGARARGLGRLPGAGYPVPATAISATDAPARARPASRTALSRSPGLMRASRIVPPGYSDVITAVTDSSP